MDVPLFGWMSIFLWSDISLTVSPQCSLTAKFPMPFPTQFMLAGCSAHRPGSPRSLKNRKDSEKLIESRRKTSLCSCAAGVEGLALINSSGRAPSYFTLIFSDRGSILSGAERKWLLQMLLPVRATEKGGRFPQQGQQAEAIESLFQTTSILTLTHNADVCWPLLFWPTNSLHS